MPQVLKLRLQLLPLAEEVTGEEVLQGVLAGLELGGEGRGGEGRGGEERGVYMTLCIYQQFSNT